MLTPLDDSLWHQIASPFENVGTSDHRFFDRMWFAVYDPAGSGSLQFTIGVYNNMNVVDGGFVVIRDTTQFNLRESRSLRPQFEPVVGAMRIDVVEPFEHIRLVVEPGEHHVHGELHWRAVLPPELEKPHVARVRGRLNEDYQRLDQVGVVDGELVVRGERWPVQQWWGCRDHSWGVRPGVGGDRLPARDPGGGRPTPDSAIRQHTHREVRERRSECDDSLVLLTAARLEPEFKGRRRQIAGKIVRRTLGVRRK